MDTLNHIGYNYKTGTSMSAPYVAGVASLIRSFAPIADWQMVRSILLQTTDPIDQLNPQFAGKLETGRLNAYEALKLIQDRPSIPTDINLIWENNHPKIIWKKNDEADLKGYRIYIKYEFRNSSNPKFWTYSYEDHFIIDCNYTDNNWFSNGSDKAYYYVKAVDINDNYSAQSSTVSCSGGLGKKITNNDESLLENYSIEAYPDPFNPITTLKCMIKKSGKVKIIINDVLGRNISEVVNEEKDAGIYEVKFNASNLTSGVYICTMKINDFIKSSKIILSK